MHAPPEILLFLGRFHPALGHLPIGFLALLGALELLARSRRYKNANASAGVILALTVPASIAAAACGWFLALGGGYDPALLAWHRWTGVATSVACLIAAGLYRYDLKKAYRWWLAFTLGLLTVTSHFGGSLTHGSDYLLEHAPAPLRQWLRGPGGSPVTAPSGQDVYPVVVAPIFSQNCVGCHGPEKSKGGLRLDSVPAMLAGGDSGPALAPGNPPASLLLKRIHLPLDTNEHMPPEGKPQPGADDIALLEWWIQTGASASKTIAQLQAPPDIQRLLDQRMPRATPVVPASPPKPLAEILPVAEPLAREFGIAINALSQTEPWLQANASLAGTNFTDAQFARLAPLAANLRWLDLGGTAVTDTGLTNLPAFRALTRLHLERTAVTDAGLAQLSQLGDLEYLNLYATAVTDTALPGLQRLPKLKQLFLWQTQVTPAAAKSFAESRLDKAQLVRWQTELAQLQANIRNARMTVDLGIALPAATNATPVNTNCPVSGKPVDPKKTVVFEGRVVAFCCDDCKAAFEKEPKKFADKLPPATAGKPINAKCPVSGKAVDPAKTTVHAGKTVAFCCDDCKAQFEKDPKPFLAKLDLGDESAKEKKP